MGMGMSEATFTWQAVAKGALEGLPFGVSSVIYGLGFGVIASAAGLTVFEAAAMSALVFSGTAQFGVVQAWSASLSLVAAFATVLITNIRYVLLGAALRPWLGSLPAKISLPALLTLVDGSFARAMAARADGESDVGHLIGASLVSWFGWVCGTIGGYGVGFLVANPKRFGLDFVVVAFCASALALMWKGRAQTLPVVVAVVAAYVCDRFIGGSWAVIAGALGAALVGAFSYRSAIAAKATP
jgi:predicted branched-subunit amino acid permease